MSDLKVTVLEEMILPNGNVERATNVKVISGVNQIQRRIDTITTFFEGNGIEIIKFTDSESKQVAGSFLKSKVKYIRITHVGGTANASIYLKKSNGESTILNLEPGKSLMFSDATISQSSSEDIFEEGYCDQSYYRDFHDLDSVLAKADKEDVQLEYIIASS
jgi:hypothetical protein